MDINVKFKSEGETLKINKKSMYRLLAIEGIESSEHTIISTVNVPSDGSRVHNKKIASKDILLEAEYTGKIKSYERKRLISFFSLHRRGLLVVEIDNVEKAIMYEVSNLSIPLPNTQVPMKFLVSLYCPSPFFRETKDIKSEIALWIGEFTFPLSIPEEGIIMGYREPSLITNVYNEGDVDTGLTIKFKALGTLSNPQLFDINTREYFRINTTLVKGDILTVDTNQYNKRVELNREGIVYNYFSYIDLKSKFLQLVPGDNLLRYDADEGLGNLEVDLYHNPKSLGV